MLSCVRTRRADAVVEHEITSKRIAAKRLFHCRACGVEGAVENCDADDGFGAPRGIVAEAQSLADQRLVVAHRGLEQRALVIKWVSRGYGQVSKPAQGAAFTCGGIGLPAFSGRERRVGLSPPQSGSTLEIRRRKHGRQ